MLVDLKRVADDLAFGFFVILVVGEKFGLLVIVGDDFIAFGNRVIDHGLAFQAHFGVHSAGGWNSSPFEGVKHAPDADALAVFAPGPVGVIINTACECAADDARAAGIDDPVRVLAGVPIFEIGGENECHAFVVGPAKRFAMGQGDVVVVHDCLSLVGKIRGMPAPGPAFFSFSCQYLAGRSEFA